MGGLGGLSGGGFAAAVFLIMASEQSLLNAGPLIVRGMEGAAAAGFIFNVLMIARAPLVLFQAVATSLLPHLTRLRASGGTRDAGAFETSVRTTLAAIAGFAALVALVVAIAGPDLMQLAFGKKFTYDRAGLLIVTVGMGFYLSSGTLNQAALAQGQVRAAAVRWVICAAAFICWNFVPVFDEFRRVEVGFAGGQVNLNTASFEELRNHRLSVTQATRVLAYRERLGGYKSIDDLDQVPGFPKDFLREFKMRARI